MQSCTSCCIFYIGETGDTLNDAAQYTGNSQQTEPSSRAQVPPLKAGQKSESTRSVQTTSRPWRLPGVAVAGCTGWSIGIGIDRQQGVGSVRSPRTLEDVFWRAAILLMVYRKEFFCLEGMLWLILSPHFLHCRELNEAEGAPRSAGGHARRLRPVHHYVQGNLVAAAGWQPGSISTICQCEQECIWQESIIEQVPLREDWGDSSCQKNWNLGLACSNGYSTYRD